MPARWTRMRAQPGRNFGMGLRVAKSWWLRATKASKGNLLFGFFRKSAPRRRRHSLKQLEFSLEPNETAVEFAKSCRKTIHLGGEGLHAVLKQDDLADRCVSASGPVH